MTELWDLTAYIAMVCHEMLSGKLFPYRIVVAEQLSTGTCMASHMQLALDHLKINQEEAAAHQNKDQAFAQQKLNGQFRASIADLEWRQCL